MADATRTYGSGSPTGRMSFAITAFPKSALKNRDAIAKMTAIREKPFDEAENIFDYRVDAEVLDKGVPRLPVTAMIANKGAVNTVRHTLAAAGVSPAGITSGNIYAQNLFASGWLSSPWEHFAFADIGEDSTRIEIFSGTNIALSRTIKNRPEKPRHGVAGILRRRPQENASASSCAAHAAAPADGGVGRGACRASLRTAAGRFIIHVALGPVPVDPAAGIPAAGAVPSTAVPNGYGHGFGTCRAFRARSALSSLAEKIPDDGISYEEGLHLLCENRRRTPEEEERLLLRLPSLSGGWPGSWNAPPTTSATLWGCRTFRASLCSPPAAAWRLR